MRTDYWAIYISGAATVALAGAFQFGPLNDRCLTARHSPPLMRGADFVDSSEVVRQHLLRAALPLDLVLLLVQVLHQQVAQGVRRLELQGKHAAGGEDP